MLKTKPSGQLKSFPELVRDAALVCYGVELPDLYVQMVMSRQLTLPQACIDYQSCDSEYRDVRVVH